ncbi:MAG: hypothetical protein AMXMBFR59_13330 [Rhodanobacteraceae bacterium]
MEAEFEDIRIVDLDLSRTTWSRVHDSLRVMFLRLDREPPDNDWPRLFFEERETRIVARRRGLWIEDGYISFDALPEEVETIHLPDIRQSVSYANRKYRELCVQRRRRQLDNLAELRSERDELLALQARVRGLIGGETAPPPAPIPPVPPAATSMPPDDTRTVDAPVAVAPAPVDAEPDPLAEFELRRNALKQAFRAAASQDKEQK